MVKLLFLTIFLFSGVQSFASPDYYSKCCLKQFGVKTCDRNLGKLICNDNQFAYDCVCPKKNQFFVGKSGVERYPKNARINDFGDGWICNEGYLQNGYNCEEIDLPRNAEYFFNLLGWRCKDGYVQYRDECRKLIIPKNAQLADDGRNWKCDKGFEIYRAKCRKIKIPDNAQLDSSGNHWNCKQGYKIHFNKCIKE